MLLQFGKEFTGLSLFSKKAYASQLAPLPRPIYGVTPKSQSFLHSFHLLYSPNLLKPQKFNKLLISSIKPQSNGILHSLIITLTHILPISFNKFICPLSQLLTASHGYTTKVGNSPLNRHTFSTKTPDS